MCGQQQHSLDDHVEQETIRTWQRDQQRWDIQQRVWDERQHIHKVHTERIIDKKSEGYHRTIHLVDNVNYSDFIKVSKYEFILISVHSKCSYYMDMDRTIWMDCNYCYKMYHTYSHLNIPDTKLCDKIMKVLICGSVHCSNFVWVVQDYCFHELVNEGATIFLYSLSAMTLKNWGSISN